jgi:nicotinate phosphoribosyltransferase
MVFKLTTLNDEPKIKISENIEKTTIPGSKIMLRFYNEK